MLGNDKPTQTINKDAEKLSEINSIPGAVQTGVNAIDHANTVMTVVDTINATYLQPLKTFNTITNTIANISFVAWLCSNPVWWLSIDTSICSDGIECVDCSL